MLVAGQSSPVSSPFDYWTQEASTEVSSEYSVVFGSFSNHFALLKLDGLLPKVGESKGSRPSATFRKRNLLCAAAATERSLSVRWGLLGSPHLPVEWLCDLFQIRLSTRG